MFSCIVCGCYKWCHHILLLWYQQWFLIKWRRFDVVLNLMSHLVAGGWIEGESEQIDLYKNAASIFLLFSPLLSSGEDNWQCRESWGSSSWWSYWKLSLCGKLDVLDKLCILLFSLLRLVIELLMELVCFSLKWENHRCAISSVVEPLMRKLPRISRKRLMMSIGWTCKAVL